MSSDFYDDSLEKAGEHLRSTIGFLSQHQIPVSPFNYRLGYDYSSGADFTLNETFDALLVNEPVPSSEKLNALYKQFYLDDNETLDQLRKDLSELVSNIQGDFVQSGGHLGKYTETLKHFAETLAVEQSPDVLSAEVRRVISDTQETENTQRHMQQQLNDMTTEMEILRKELIRAKQVSLTDGLTGVRNRKAFDEALAEAISANQQSGEAYVVLLMDVDHFKKVNDNHGHLVGDRVLKFVAMAAKRSVKGKDMVARYGGEEFAVILKDTDMSGGLAVAEDIRKAIAAGVLRDTKSQEAYGRVTISIGMTQMMATDNADDLLKRADQALYRAKDNGRNRVEQAAAA